MTWQQFTVAIVNLCIWPAVVLFAVWLIRRELREIRKQVERTRLGE